MSKKEFETKELEQETIEAARITDYNNLLSQLVGAVGKAAYHFKMARKFDTNSVQRIAVIYGHNKLYYEKNYKTYHDIAIKYYDQIIDYSNDLNLVQFKTMENDDKSKKMVLNSLSNPDRRRCWRYYIKKSAQALTFVELEKLYQKRLQKRRKKR